jgi:type IX secretion system PorP/SprF family membrane protein
MKKTLLIFLFIISILGIKAQEQPTYTQHMFNQQTFNPAYTGTWEKLGITLINRSQWVKFPKYPQTNDLSVQLPVFSLNHAIGLDVSNNRIGLENRTGIYADYSYRVRLSEDGWYLRLGLKAGVSIYNNDLTDYRLINPDDPAYADNIGNMVLPNFGAGLFLWRENAYVGFSVPKILSHKLKITEAEYQLKPSSSVFYLTGGYVFNLHPNWQLKPSVFMQIERHSPFQCDISASVLFKDFLWLGAMYRFGDAFGFIVQFTIKNDFRIGYAYDQTISKLSSHQQGVHEILLTIEINTMKTRYHSPRRF